MSKKVKVFISFTLGIVGIILVITGIIILNSFKSEKVITYFCSLSNHQKINGISNSIEEYNFKVDLKEKKFLSFRHSIIDFYEDEKTFNEVSEKIATLVKENPDSNVEYIYFNNNLSINKSIKEILYEDTIDYSKRTWLGNYINLIKKKGYSCVSTENKK